MLVNAVIGAVFLKGIPIGVFCLKNAVYPDILGESIYMVESEEGYAVCHLDAHTVKGSQRLQGFLFFLMN